jgi:hypothetical protein
LFGVDAHFGAVGDFHLVLSGLVLRLWIHFLRHMHSRTLGETAQGLFRTLGDIYLRAIRRKIWPLAWGLKLRPLPTGRYLRATRQRESNGS